jgi:membrane-bound serine protease (ClpP class)
VFIVAGVLLAIFVLPAPWGWAAVGLGIGAEVVETIVAMRLLRRRPPGAGSEALIGAVGRAISACRPMGEMRVRGEVWRARCEAGADPGDRVRITAREGATLVVEREPEPYPDRTGR